MSLSKAEHLARLRAAAAQERADWQELEARITEDAMEPGIDGKPITLNDSQEVHSWTVHLHCTEAQLRDAVASVGSSAPKVQAYLQRRRRAR